MTHACPECRHYMDEIQDTILQLGPGIEAARKGFNAEGIAALQACVQDVRRIGDHLEDLLWQFSQHKTVMHELGEGT